MVKTSRSLLRLTTMFITWTASFVNLHAAITNPLVSDSILFITRDVCPAGRAGVNGAEHYVDQFWGFNACPNGGLYILSGVKSGALKVTDILENSVVQNGRLKGKKLVGGGFLSPDLSYDGKSILFAWVEQPNATESWAQEQCFHIFKVQIDGTGLTQLTDGNYNDIQPCWLPNGRIVFISERCGGFGRCHPRINPNYVLYSMKADGTDMVRLSFHDTNEEEPSVANDGTLVYTRWDYVDRDDCISHNLWTCMPDGQNPRAPHANYPLPLSTMSGSNWQDGRFFRPMTENNIRAIPNSNKFVSIGTGHHSQSYGEVIIIDPTIPDDNMMSQITGVTSHQTTWGDNSGHYGTPWALSEDWFLANKDSSIVLLDKNGGEQIVYTASWGRPLDPTPLRPRVTPPALTCGTWQGERAGLPDHRNATISVMNVNYGDTPLPTGTVIKSIRIFQIIPQYTPLINQTRIGYASENLARVCLGTVPVESDGSAYFYAPVERDLYFQLIDDKGMAVQSMRSATYVHPGEQLTCVGCHENKWEAPPLFNPIATRRAPSQLQPEAGAENNGVTTMNFYRLVKPVFDAKCTPCHLQQNKGPDMSYGSLQNYAWWLPGPGNPYVNGDIVTALHGGSRSTPGQLGAHYATLTQYCNSTHHNVNLTQEELGRITLWLDGNSTELSAYTHVAEQKNGELIWPELDFDPQNGTGVENLSTTAVVNNAKPILNVEKLSISGNRLEITNPSAGMIRIKVFNANGRLVNECMGSSRRISLAMPATRGFYFIAIYGKGEHLLKQMQIVRS